MATLKEQLFVLFNPIWVEIIQLTQENKQSMLFKSN